MTGIVSDYIKIIKKTGAFLTILSLGLILSPLIFWPTAPVPYEVPRVWFIMRLIEVLAVIGIINLLKIKKGKIDTKLLISVNLLFVVAIITALTGSNFVKSLTGNYYRSDGLITFGHFLLLFYLIALLGQNSWKKVLSASIALGSTLAAIWALTDALRFFVLHQNIINFEGAIGGTFGQPNFLGGYLLVAMPLTLFQIVNSRNKLKLAWIVSLILQILSILLTNSRASILGIPIFFIAFAILQKNRYKKIIIAVSLITFAVGTVFFLQQFKSHIVPDRITAEGRTRIFAKALIGFREKPLLGWGWANFDYLFTSIDWPIKLGNDVYVDKPHSTIIEIATTTGIFGLILYLAVIIRGGKLLYKKDKYFFLVFLLFIMHSQTNIISSAEEIIFWIALGISVRPILEE